MPKKLTVVLEEREWQESQEWKDYLAQATLNQRNLPLHSMPEQYEPYNEYTYVYEYDVDTGAMTRMAFYKGNRFRDYTFRYTDSKVNEFFPTNKGIFPSRKSAKDYNGHIDYGYLLLEDIVDLLKEERTRLMPYQYSNEREIKRIDYFLRALERTNSYDYEKHLHAKVTRWR